MPLDVRRQRWRLTMAMMLLVAACGSPATTSPGGTATAGTPPPGATTPSASTSGGGGTGGAPGARACDLLTDPDIEELTKAGVTAKADNVLDTVYVNHCRWSLEAGEINLGVVSPGGRTWYDEHVAIVDGMEPVAGLPADIATREELTGSIFALKDDTLIDVYTIGILAPDENLVRRILENLE